MIWFGLILVALAKVPCANYGFPGFSFKGHRLGEDRYFNSAEKVELKVKCLPANTTFDQTVEKLSKESSVRNTGGDAVYFEFNENGQFSRVYVVDRKPVVQLTFSARERFRSALDATEALVEKYYKKSSLPPSKN